MERKTEPPDLYVKGFDFIASPGATVLILGSVPSLKSVEYAAYYGHPRNAFWPILHDIASVPYDQNVTYAKKKQLIHDMGIALWDVIGSCRRKNSLDASIDASGIEVNDFSRLFWHCRSIRAVFFNGRSTFSFYKKYVPETQKKWFPNHAVILPSTSPANAGMSVGQKKKVWSQLNIYLPPMPTQPKVGV